MRLPTPPTEATRFFARVLSAILECPRCGNIIHFLHVIDRQAKVSGGRWNPRTAQMTCRACSLDFVIGLIAWPVEPGSHGRTVARDQVPNERQLVQMRNMGEGAGAGWWMPKAKAVKARRTPHTNITAWCCCGENSDGTPKLPPSWRCPIHGDGVSGVKGWETRGDHYPREGAKKEED